MGIIILDHDADRQRQLRQLLSCLGYRSADVDSAFDLKHVLKVLRGKKIEGCFFVLDRPHLDPIPLLGELRSAGILKSIPVVIVGIGTKREEVATFARSGACFVLAYPYSAENVEAAIQSIARGKPSD